MERISLSSSWVTAVTITPLFCSWAYKSQAGKSEEYDPYHSGFFKVYRKFLIFCLRHGWLVIIAMIALWVFAGFGFGMLDNAFFPETTRP